LGGERATCHVIRWWRYAHEASVGRVDREVSRCFQVAEVCTFVGTETTSGGTDRSYSCLSATIGSTLVARRAGKYAARNAMPTSNKEMPAKVAGSVAFTLNRKPAITLALGIRAVNVSSLISCNASNLLTEGSSITTFSR